MSDIHFQYPKYNELNPASCRSVAIENKYPEFWQYLNNKYSSKQVTFAEMLYLFYNDMEEPPRCICGGRTKFLGFKRGYRDHCSYACRYNDPSVKEKTKMTNIRLYGVANPMYSAEIRQKLRNTVRERYGVDNVFQSQESKNKARQTNIERYGTEYANQSESVKEKIKISKQSNIIEKYPDILDIDGNIYTMKCPDSTCRECKDKQFKISSSVLYDRVRLHADLCTNRSPVGAHIRNTSLEIFVKNILDEYHISYITNDRSVLDGKELDIYIPDYNLAIECNGVYWHSQYDSKYHYDKWKRCKDKGIMLMSIWEDWIDNKPEIVRNIILSKLGIYRERIYARSCRVRVVSAREVRIFLDNNHIQGFCNSTYKYGLYYNDELVSLMTFGSYRKSILGKDNGWELLRFCTKADIQVVGGAEKLLNHFHKEHPGDIISFSSHDISNGNLYRKLGFEKAGETQTTYWYVHSRTHKRYHRSSFMKKELIKKGWDPKMTEEQIMIQTDYFRIYDSGQDKYIKKYSI